MPSGHGSSDRTASSDTECDRLERYEESLGKRRVGRTVRVFVVAMVLALSVAGVPVQPVLADSDFAWTAVESPEQNVWLSVAYGDGVWIAVSYDGDNRVMRSTDGGTTWQAIAAPTSEWQSVAYGDGVWVAVANGRGGADPVMRSTDRGLTWTAIPAPSGVLGDWIGVAHGDGVWIGMLYDDDRVMRSTDGGQTWTVIDVTDNDWWSAAHGDGVWVAVNINGDLMRSVDRGVTWTDIDTGLDHDWYSVAYADGTWIAVSYDGSAMRSTNGGATWATVTVPAGQWWSVAHGNGQWVAIAQGGVANLAMRSTDDGLTWAAVEAAERNGWYSVAYGAGAWVAVSSDGVNRIMRALTPVVVQSHSAPVLPTVSCVPEALVVAGTVTCTVTGGDAGIDILWRAAYNPVFAEAGVTLDASGSGEFSFTVPAAALGEELTVELVEWTAPQSLGVVGGPVPGSVPAGEGPLPVWTLLLTALVGVGLLRRGMRAEA